MTTEEVRGPERALVLDTPAHLLDLGADEIGTSSWRTVAQGDIDGFATATGDHQWIHVDPQRAADGPFGVTIAHGMLTLSLVPLMIGEVVAVRGASFGLNYGFDRVRFPGPVRVGSRIRAAVALVAAEPMTGGVRATFRATVECAGASRPVCVADNIIAWWP